MFRKVRGKQYKSLGGGDITYPTWPAAPTDHSQITFLLEVPRVECRAQVISIPGDNWAPVFSAATTTTGMLNIFDPGRASVLQWWCVMLLDIKTTPDGFLGMSRGKDISGHSCKPFGRRCNTTPTSGRRCCVG